jgi:hypothetical protein
MTRLAAVAAALVVLAGCGSDPDSGPDAEQVAGAATESPDTEASGAPEGDGEFVPEYASATELLDALRSGGIKCDTETEPASTVVSADAWFCYTNETRDDGYWLDVFASGEQQGEAMVYMTEENPGTTFVVGTGWSVGLPSGSDGAEVVDAVGGQVYE